MVDLKYRFIEIVSGIKYCIPLSDRLRCYHKCTRWYFGNSISFSFYSPNFEMQIGSKPLDTILNFFVANYINFTILDFASRDAFIRQFNWLKPFCFERWISKNRKQCQPAVHMDNGRISKNIYLMRDFVVNFHLRHVIMSHQNEMFITIRYAKSFTT